METGRGLTDKRPIIIEKSDQVHGNILDGPAPDQEPKFRTREAYDMAQTTVKNVLIPSSGVPDGAAGQGPRSGTQATMDLSTSKPPPRMRGEVASQPHDEDDSDDDRLGGIVVDD
eukprot:4507500-Pyramimonas_sp.AAC.1